MASRYFCQKPLGPSKARKWHVCARNSNRIWGVPWGCLHSRRWTSEANLHSSPHTTQPRHLEIYFLSPYFTFWFNRFYIREQEKSDMKLPQNNLSIYSGVTYINFKTFFRNFNILCPNLIPAKGKCQESYPCSRRFKLDLGRQKGGMPLWATLTRQAITRSFAATLSSTAKPSIQQTPGSFTSG